MATFDYATNQSSVHVYDVDTGETVAMFKIDTLTLDQAERAAEFAALYLNNPDGVTRLLEFAERV